MTARSPPPYRSVPFSRPSEAPTSSSAISVCCCLHFSAYLPISFYSAAPEAPLVASAFRIRRRFESAFHFISSAGFRDTKCACGEQASAAPDSTSYRGPAKGLRRGSYCVCNRCSRWWRAANRSEGRWKASIEGMSEPVTSSARSLEVSVSSTCCC